MNAQSLIDRHIDRVAEQIITEDEIARRWSWRTWYRTTARGLFHGRWDDLAVDNDRELRRLVTRLR